MKSVKQELLYVETLTAHESGVNTANWKAENILQKKEQTAIQRGEGK